jgi:hypothetical protein
MIFVPTLWARLHWHQAKKPINEIFMSFFAFPLRLRASAVKNFVCFKGQ